MLSQDDPDTSVVKTLCCHCRTRFDPWLGNQDPTCCMAWAERGRDRERGRERGHYHIQKVSGYYICMHMHMASRHVKRCSSFVVSHQGIALI